MLSFAGLKQINIPADVLAKVLNEKEIKELQQAQVGIYSITVVGYKD